ncbi:hypothetical protein [Paenibacillus sp. FSL R10-2734]
MYPGANIAVIDYDAGVSVVNQANRIKLMMSIANGLDRNCTNKAIRKRKE